MTFNLRDGYVIHQLDHGVKSLCIESERKCITLAKAEMPQWDEYGSDICDSKEEARECYIMDNKPQEEVPEDILKSWNDELDLSFTRISCKWDDYTTFKGGE